MNTPKADGFFKKDEYVEKFGAARSRLAATKAQTVDWVSTLSEMAKAEFHHIEPVSELFPRKAGGETYRLIYEVQTTAKRYGTLGVALRTDRMRTDLAKLTTGELTQLLKPHCDEKDARAKALSFQRFHRFNERVAALRFLGIDFDVPTTSGPVVPRWLEALSLYGPKCSGPVEAAFDEFMALSGKLDEAMFDFNSAVGKARYRAIRCTYTVDDHDLLGPSDPALKVITFIRPSTNRRRYNVMTDFKKALKRKRIGQQLKRSLGRDPVRAEIDDALRALRPRKETEWITKDVIKACYLGRHIKEIFAAQENLVAVMQPWSAKRAQLQALLP